MISGQSPHWGLNADLITVCHTEPPIRKTTTTNETQEWVCLCSSDGQHADLVGVASAQFLVLLTVMHSRSPGLNIQWPYFSLPHTDSSVTCVSGNQKHKLLKKVTEDEDIFIVEAYTRQWVTVKKATVRFLYIKKVKNADLTIVLNTRRIGLIPRI